MKKNDFLESLHLKLTELGLSDEAAAYEVARVKVHIDVMPDDEVSFSPDEMAVGIMQMLKNVPESDLELTDAPLEADCSNLTDQETSTESTKFADAAAEPNDVDKPVDAQNFESTFGDEFDAVFAERGDDIPADESESEEDDEDMKIFVPHNSSLTENDEVVSSEEPDKDSSGDIEDINKDDCADSPTAGENKSPDYGLEDFDTYMPESHKKNKNINEKSAEEINVGNRVLFWVIFAIALPIVLGLAAVIVLAYIGFWTLLALLMIACVIILIVFVALGAIVSLVGIVYGVVQIITGQVPIGLFEIGLGVCVGAGVMFVGILLYNFAIRLIPFAMKKLGVLVKFSFRKAREGYRLMKGAVENI